jgi:hypothetical protein
MGAANDERVFVEPLVKAPWSAAGFTPLSFFARVTTRRHELLVRGVIEKRKKAA